MTSWPSSNINLFLARPFTPNASLHQFNSIEASANWNSSARHAGGKKEERKYDTSQLKTCSNQSNPCTEED